MSVTVSFHARLEDKYTEHRAGYTNTCSNYGDPQRIDAELVETVIMKMKCGKAAGLDGLRYCHVLFPCILAKLFGS